MKTTTRRNLALILLAVLLATSICLAQEIILTPQKAGGAYGIGEKIHWQVELKGEGAANVPALRYMLKKGGLTVMREGKIDLAAGPGVLEASLDEPGTILAEVEASLPAKKIKALAGAVVAPDKIKPSAPRPDAIRALPRLLRALRSPGRSASAC